MQRSVKNPRSKNRTVKTFHIDTSKPVSVRFINPVPELTRVTVKGRNLANDSIELPALRGRDATHKLDFEVEFAKKKGERFLHHSRKLDIEIRSGDKLYRDTVQPDIAGRSIAYRL